MMARAMRRSSEPDRHLTTVGSRGIGRKVLVNRKKSGELFLNHLDMRGLTVARALATPHGRFASQGSTPGVNVLRYDII